MTPPQSKRDPTPLKGGALGGDRQGGGGVQASASQKPLLPWHVFTLQLRGSPRKIITVKLSNYEQKKGSLIRKESNPLPQSHYPPWLF